MHDHSLPYYNQFYRNRNSWGYDYHAEKNMLQEHILPYASIPPRGRILDLGCGDGFHSMILADLGYEVYGVDNSPEGINRAKERESAAKFTCTNAALLDEIFEKAFFDCIYCRGLSWYHYELNSNNRHGINVLDETKNILQYLKPAGTFILQIATDFSGGTDRVSGVINNKLDAYVSFFAQLGKVARIADWRGNNLAEAGNRWYGINLFFTRS